MISVIRSAGVCLVCLLPNSIRVRAINGISSGVKLDSKKRKKKINCQFIQFHVCTFRLPILPQSDYISHNWDFIYHNCDFISLSVLYLTTWLSQNFCKFVFRIYFNFMSQPDFLTTVNLFFIIAILYLAIWFYISWFYHYFLRFNLL